MLRVSLPHQAPPFGWGGEGESPQGLPRERAATSGTCRAWWRPLREVQAQGHEGAETASTRAPACGEAVGRRGVFGGGLPWCGLGVSCPSGIRRGWAIGILPPLRITPHRPATRAGAGSWGSGAAPASGPLRPAPRPRATSSRRRVIRFTLCPALRFAGPRTTTGPHQGHSRDTRPPGTPTTGTSRPPTPRHPAPPPTTSPRTHKAKGRRRGSGEGRVREAGGAESVSGLHGGCTAELRISRCGRRQGLTTGGVGEAWPSASGMTAVEGRPPYRRRHE